MPKGIKGFQKGHPPFSGSFKKGYKQSKEHTENIRKAIKRRYESGEIFGFQKGDKIRLGKYSSEESKIKMSLAHIGQRCGEKCHLWKGGVSKVKGHINRKRREWRHKNPLRVKFHNYKRRFLTKDLTLQIIQLVYEDNIKQYGTLTCYLCTKPIPFGKDHLEHKIPLSRGGTNQYNNLAIACQRCNCKKNNKTEVEYKKEVLKNDKC